MTIPTLGCEPKEKTMKCPTCQSPQPHLHPAMQFEGEVQPCRDAYHRTVTPQNTPEKIAAAEAILDLTRKS